MASRTRNSIKNIYTGAFGQILNMALGFVVRTVFIHTLTETYLGINGLLSSVFSVLNLANLGIDGAIVFALYKPVAENNTAKTKSLMRFYRNAYRIIGWVILAAGLALTPFLTYLTKGGTELVDLRIAHWLLLAQTVLSYWFFAYLSSLLIADQRRYEIARVDYGINTALAMVRIALLFALRASPVTAFYVFSAMGVVFNVARNLFIRRRAITLYPWLRDTDTLPMESAEKASVFKNMAGMFTNNVCRVLNDGIDSTIITAYLGLDVTGVYSNYLVIKGYVLHVVKTILDPLTAGVGNLCAVEGEEKKESFFYSLQFFCFWMYGLFAICMWTLFNSFIVGVWLHDTKWLISDLNVFLLVINLLIEGLAKAVIIYRDANGLFWQTRYRYIFSSVFNAVLSVVLVGPLGLGVTGALLGTTVSVAIMVSYDPVLVFREVFHKKAGSYYLLYLKDLLLVLGTGALVHLVCLPFSAFTFMNFALRLLVCLALPNLLWYFIFRRDARFVYLRDTFLGFVRGVLRRFKRKQ